MSANEAFLLVIRWLHLVSAAAWVGGSLFYLLVLRPAMRRAPEASRDVSTLAASEFQALVDTCIFVLLATGIILTFDRLSSGFVEVPYAVILGLKIALSVWMFLLARGRRRRVALLASDVARPQNPTRLQKVSKVASGYNSIVILGIVVFLLADLLRELYEVALLGE